MIWTYLQKNYWKENQGIFLDFPIFKYKHVNETI